MAEKLPVLETSAKELGDIEEIDDIEELTVDEDAQTGAHARSQVLNGTGETGLHSAPARSSAPPPVPPEARQSRPPAVRTSALPPPPRSPSHSGMFRIEQMSGAMGGTAPALRGGASVSAPSLPPPAALDADKVASESVAGAESSELRESRAQVNRLRLMVRLREDRIRELELALRDKTDRVEALQRDLTGFKSQRGPDDLKRISGIGPGFERALHAAGVTTFRQIAAWTADDVERIAAKLRIVTKRISRDRWIEGARQILEDDQLLTEA